MRSDNTPIERPTVPLVDCVCGRTPCDLLIEHELKRNKPKRVMMHSLRRYSCPCGLAAQWDKYEDNARINWNELIEALGDSQNRKKA